MSFSDDDEFDEFADFTDFNSCAPGGGGGPADQAADTDGSFADDLQPPAANAGESDGRPSPTAKLPISVDATPNATELEPTQLQPDDDHLGRIELLFRQSFPIEANRVANAADVQIESNLFRTDHMQRYRVVLLLDVHSQIIINDGLI